MSQPKKCAVLMHPADLPRVSALPFSENGYEILPFTAYLVPSTECWPANLRGTGPEVDCIVYVLTENSVESTMFAVMTYQAPYLCPGNPEQWLLNLDQVRIPRLMEQLTHVPMGPPGIHVTEVPLPAESARTKSDLKR